MMEMLRWWKKNSRLIQPFRFRRKKENQKNRKNRKKKKRKKKLFSRLDLLVRCQENNQLRKEVAHLERDLLRRSL
jgi:hypothetical protein